MTGWQAERFVMEHQTEIIDVVSTLGRFSGRTCGVRFDREQRRFVLPLRERRGECRRIPVNAILELRAMGDRPETQTGDPKAARSLSVPRGVQAS